MELTNQPSIVWDAYTWPYTWTLQLFTCDLHIFCMYLPWTPHLIRFSGSHFYLLPLPWPSFIPPWMEVARIPLSQWDPFALMESSSLPQKPRTTWNDAWNKRQDLMATMNVCQVLHMYTCIPYVNRLGDLVDPFCSELGYTWVYIIHV